MRVAGCFPLLELPLLELPTTLLELPPPRDSAPTPFSFPLAEAAACRRVTAGVASRRRPRCCCGCWDTSSCPRLAPAAAEEAPAAARALAAGLFRLADSMMQMKAREDVRWEFGGREVEW